MIAGSLVVVTMSSERSPRVSEGWNGGGGEVKVHGKGLLLVNCGAVGGGPGEEVADSGLEWLVVSAGVVDGCC